MKINEIWSFPQFSQTVPHTLNHDFKIRLAKVIICTPCNQSGIMSIGASKHGRRASTSKGKESHPFSFPDDNVFAHSGVTIAVRCSHADVSSSVVRRQLSQKEGLEQSAVFSFIPAYLRPVKDLDFGDVPCAISIFCVYAFTIK
jgi:hypothetical protein